jgi:hypothetical protein
MREFEQVLRDTYTPSWPGQRARPRLCGFVSTWCHARILPAQDANGEDIIREGRRLLALDQSRDEPSRTASTCWRSVRSHLSSLSPHLVPGQPASTDWPGPFTRTGTGTGTGTGRPRILHEAQFRFALGLPLATLSLRHFASSTVRRPRKRRDDES